MEEVLQVYQRPYDPQFPQLCMDESSKQLEQELLASLPMQPGQPERYDYLAQSQGSGKLFLVCEPLTGKRYVKVSEQRTKRDWALFMREVLEGYYPQAEKVVLVLDNLNTHTPAAFYEVFAPEEARRLSERLEVHYTPKHGSWLNMAEIELSVLARQCLAQRLGSQAELEQQVQAWQQRRNAAAITVDWRFTTADARIKLKRLYPVLTPLASSEVSVPNDP